MSGATPLVGPVYGWRTWDIGPGSPLGVSWSDPDGEYRLRSRGTVWDEATQHARCLEGYGPGGVMAAAVFGQQPTFRERTGHEPVTDPRCWCGLYAHATLGRCLDDRDYALKPTEHTTPTRRIVLGLVAAFGRTIAAERGFRAQAMAVDTLVCLRHRTFPGVWAHQPRVHEAARLLGVPTVCIRKRPDAAGVRRQFEAVFADREGVYLWQKEAPWTSDATSEPSTSSSRGSVASVTLTAETDPFQHVLRDLHYEAAGIGKQCRCRPADIGDITTSATSEDEDGGGR